ncbi:hypothetical protein [Xanthomonas tesorieronis]|uniref:hypothetical protein n=1 Tax=Xanthomonas tesorieronis TaxID=3160839 RepID=UPI0035115F32
MSDNELLKMVASLEGRANALSGALQAILSTADDVTLQMVEKVLATGAQAAAATTPLVGETYGLAHADGYQREAHSITSIVETIRTGRGAV